MSGGREDPVERLTRNAVVDVVRRDLGIDWGPPHRRDACDDSGLRVDYTFDEANVALEVTSVPNQSWRAIQPEIDKLEEDLTAFARDRRLGGWVIAVFTTADMRAISPAVKPLMEAGTEISPMRYTSEDLIDARARGELHAFRNRHRHLDGMGLSKLERQPASDEVSVFVVGPEPGITGFSAELAKAVADNGAKLAEARPRETHLAVLVDRWQCSNDPARTSPPVLPAEIDMLWVVHVVRTPNGEAFVWQAHRGDESWRHTTSVPLSAA